MKNRTMKSVALGLVAILLLLQLHIVSFAQNTKITNVVSNIPEIKAEINQEINTKNIKAEIDGTAVELIDTPTSLKNAKKLTCFVIDNSTSMVDSQQTPNGLFTSAKQDVKTLIKKNFSENDNFMAFSIGEKLTKIGAATDKKTADKLCQKVQALEADANGTSLSEGLLQVHEILAKLHNDYESIKVMLITDKEGEYSNDGGSVDEVIELYRYKEIPLYSVCLTDQKNNANLRDLNRLAVESGGYGSIYTSNTIASDYTEMTTGSIIKFATQLEKDNNEKRLCITIDGTELKPVSFTANRAQNFKGKVTAKIIGNTKNAITLEFDRTVVHATNISNITVLRGKKEVQISKITPLSTKQYCITFEKDIYNGIYTIKFGGDLTDTSNSKNKINNIDNYEIKNAKSTFWMVFPYLMILLAVIIVLLAFYLVLLFLKKKKNVNTIKELFETQTYETVEEHHYIQNQQLNRGKKVMLYSQTANYPQQRVSLNVVSSFIVGRSNICDVYIDDAKLSRQHFAIEYTEGVFMLQDLETTNGTFINGVRVRGRQKLNSGDMIEAGLTRIRIEY